MCDCGRPSDILNSVQRSRRLRRRRGASAATRPAWVWAWCHPARYLQAVAHAGHNGPTKRGNKNRQTNASRNTYADDYKHGNRGKHKGHKEHRIAQRPAAQRVRRWATQISHH